ncbi:hypothetical protein J27TS7_30630 [Paenibacillus dendritiformis]|nr:hypothetical protein J27TS7_30630 [Paenibacillus dendritiformis]
MTTPLPSPADEVPPPAPGMAYAAEAPNPEEIPHPPPPEPAQAAAEQVPDDILWRRILSRVPASYSMPDGVIVEALQRAHWAAAVPVKEGWPKLWRRGPLRYNVT